VKSELEALLVTEVLILFFIAVDFTIILQKTLSFFLTAMN